ncbi:hypothetical protein [Geminisphaera colitermitum]|uniref:hypothetical protein n=1 Tax=Geminisphaera colitermitum TaxID=1148786 RepID=UPI0001964F7B|nr:hypothetical protein [Geminisphaera colitermitum]
MKPATASAETGEASFTLPAGTEVTFSETLGTFTAKLPKDSSVKLTTRKETATAPQAFTPPSPAEQATGKRVLIYTFAALACLALAGLLAWRAHWLAAVCAGLGAAVCHLLSSPAGLWIAGVLVAVAGAFFIAWHLLTRAKPAPSA